MPRRLGDDPLARAKAAAADAQAATVMQSSDSAPYPSRRPTTRGSYNDVFFRRRGEEDGPVAKVSVAEGPEITEISEIPEIREVAAAPIAEDAGPVEIKVIEPETTTEDVVAHLAAYAPVEKSDSIAPPAPAAEPVMNVVAVLEAEESASVPVAPQTPSQDGAQPKTEKEGGFFKRLFGKFGK